jgi:uncharacterized protein YciI
MLFWVEFHPCRPDFHATMTPEENAVMVGHLNDLAAHQAEGRLKFAGRAADASHGLAIFDVESAEALRGLLAENPACKAGVLRPLVREHRIPGV